MARLFLSNHRVRTLVSELVPLFAAAGSINRLCELLNQAIGTGGGQKEIYPNRLHTILSEEQTRSLNEASVATIETAAAALKTSQPELVAASARNLRDIFERVKAA